MAEKIMHVDLTKESKSMSAIIMNNHGLLDTAGNVGRLLEQLNKLFEENQLDTPASRRLIVNVGRQKNFASALQVIYNSMLCGAGCAVNQR